MPGNTVRCGVQQVRAAAVDHRAPTWRRRLHTEPEEAQRGLRQDGGSHAKRRLHGHDGQGGRQHVMRERTPRARAERPGRHDILELLRAHHLRPDQARVAHPPDDRERQDDVDKTGAEDCNEGDGEQDAGEREQDVHHSADQLIDAAAVVSGERTEERAHGR
jgi:hypothetical protein